MSVEVIYYVHGTTPYNEQGIASGQSNIGLSAQGIEDAKKLARLTQDLQFDAIYTSDLPRATETTELAFGKRFPVIKEPRLREIDDGAYTGTPIKETPGPHMSFLDQKYPKGESFRDVEKRIKNLLDELKEKRDGQRVAFVGHFAPQMALEVLTNNKTWERAFAEDWRKTKSWQPGWKYVIP